MTLDDVYRTVQSTPHGSSGRGNSYWKQAVKCGRFTNLQAQLPEKSSMPGTDLNPLRIGTFYHALHEHHAKPENAIWDMTNTMVEDIDWMEALRVFRAYVQDWGSVWEKWGFQDYKVEADFEIPVPGLEEMFTARLDGIGRIDDIDGVYQRTGLQLPEPGLYVLDLKQAGQLNSMHEWEFQFGTQGAAYSWMAGAKGTIFDEVVRHKQIRKHANIRGGASYQHIFAAANPDAEILIRKMVERGKLNILTDWANSTACFDGYKPCPFFTNGTCSRV